MDKEAKSEWQVTFLRLAPGSRLAWHTGTSNERLTAHLGLIVPSEESADSDRPLAHLSVGSADGIARLTWRENRALVFDDSFFHSAVNRASSARYILYATFWHPDLGPFVEPVRWKGGEDR